MKHYCSYHPVTSAQAKCPGCEGYFCSACLEASAGSLGDLPCPRCKGALQALDNLATPQTELSYPRALYQVLKQPALRVALLASTGLAILLLFAAPSPNILHELLGLASVTLLSALALQQRHPAQKAIDRESFIASLLGFLGLGLAIWSLQQSAHGWAMLLPVVLVSPITALVLLSALARTEDQLSERFKQIPRYLATIKRDVALLVLLSLGVFWGWATIIDFCQRHLSATQTLAIAVVTLAFALLSFGEWLLQLLEKHQLLTPTSARKARQQALRPATSDALRIATAQVDMALKDGDYPQACELLLAEMKRGNQRVCAEPLFNLMEALHDRKGLLQHSHAFLILHLRNNDTMKALAFLAQLRKLDPQFRIFDCALALELARACRKHKQHKQALWLAHEAHIRFENDQGVADLYLLAAKTLVEAFKEHDKARSYLNHINKQFPDSECARHAQILLRHIEAQQTS